MFMFSSVVKSESRSAAAVTLVLSDSLRGHGLHNPWNSPGQNTGEGGLSLLQGIFPTQESNRSLLHCRRILYQLSYQGNLLLCKWTLNLTSKLSQILLSYFL